MAQADAKVQFVDPKLEGQLAARSIVRWVLWLALATCVIVPHSFQLFTILLLALATALSVAVIKRDPWLEKVLVTYMFGAILTAVYIWVGYANGAPRAASNQTLLVYLISPMMWILIGTAVMQLYGIERLVAMMVRFTWMAVTSVALFFYLFLTFGREAVRFLTEDANVNVSGGFAGATILVYGSLIFLTGALFAQPMLIKNRYGRIILPGLLVLCALTSGRSALILSIPVGFAVGALLRSRLRRDGLAVEGSRAIWLPMILLALVGLAAIALMDFLLAEVDLSVVFDEFLTELLSGGGSVRTEQAAALWDGFLDSYGIGVGHGVGVDYIRNTDFPWRYEVIPLATLLRVGLIGTVIYMSTFLLYGGAFIRRLHARDLGPADIYLIGGFVAVSFAAFTNPYIESFVFQWMYFLPVMSIAVRPLVAPPEAVAPSPPPED